MQILESHPEVKRYFGIDPSFKYVIVAMVLFQVYMAYLLQGTTLRNVQSHSHIILLIVAECPVPAAELSRSRSWTRSLGSRSWSWCSEKRGQSWPAEGERRLALRDTET